MNSSKHSRLIAIGYDIRPCFFKHKNLNISTYLKENYIDPRTVIKIAIR